MINYSGTGFIKIGESEFNPEPTGSPNAFDRDCVKLLKEAIFTRHKKMRRQIRDQFWAKNFTYLRKKDKIPKEKIHRVLVWYCKSLRQKVDYLPIAFSASAFRKKWFNILEAFNRAKNNGTASEVKVKAKAKRIAKRLSSKGWPKGSKEQLPVCVQLSLSKFRKFRKLLTNLIEQTERRATQATKISRFSKKLLEYLGQEAVFVERWFSEVHRDVANWSDWNGNLKAYVFKYQGDRFRKLAYSLATNYCGDASLWDTIKEQL